MAKINRRRRKFQIQSKRGRRAKLAKLKIKYSQAVDGAEKEKICAKAARLSGLSAAQFVASCK